MRVVFLYTSQGAAGKVVPWNAEIESKNHFVGEHGLPTEGYFKMLLEMRERGIIDELIVFIESNRSPGKKIISDTLCLVTPKIDCVEDYLKDNDVIFVRGGFRGWYDPFLITMKKQKRWLLLYAANTGRERWTIWDIVLDDLIDVPYSDGRNRFFLPFKKPIDPDIFQHLSSERDIDICIGASKIHDKKAQWLAIDALVSYKHLFNKSLKSILPGSMKYRGVQTNQIIPKIEKNGLDVIEPGFVNRYEMNKIYNRSKMFIYLGNSGQNDRGPLEAVSTGCPLLLGGRTRHAPYLGRGESFGINVIDNSRDIEAIAEKINSLLATYNESTRIDALSYFDKNNGFDSVVLPDMERLFRLIRKNPVPDVEALKGEYL